MNFALLTPCEAFPQEGKSKQGLHQEYHEETCFAIMGKAGPDPSSVEVTETPTLDNFHFNGDFEIIALP